MNIDVIVISDQSAFPADLRHHRIASIDAQSALDAVELGAIAWVRRHFMATPWTSAIFQVVLGGALVFAVGVLLGMLGVAE